MFILIPLSLHRMSNLSSGGVPIPQVYSYWGAQNNPVRAEWTIMPGNLLSDCIKSLTGQQKCRTGADLGQNSFCIATNGVLHSLECSPPDPASILAPFHELKQRTIVLVRYGWRKNGRSGIHESNEHWGSMIDDIRVRV